MRKKVLWISMLAVAILCACTTKENNEKLIMTPTPTPAVTAAPTETLLPTPTNTPVATPTPTKQQVAQTYINSLETIELTDLDCYVDLEESIRNSNLLNYGWLTYDEEGNIYYSKEFSDGIYTCSATGENQRLMYEDKGGGMQVKNEWLYYRRRKDKGIYRIHIVTGERETIYEDESAEFIINEDRIAIDGVQEFCRIDLEGNNKEVLQAPSEINLYTFTSCNEFWLSNAAPVLKKGYLFVYDGEKLHLLNKRGTYPLLAGKYLSVVDSKTKERHIWNLNTGQDSNLKVETDKAIASDGTNFYYSDWKYKGSTPIVVFYRWNNMKTEELFIIENINPIHNMFLTSEKIYFHVNYMESDNSGSHLYYYDLVTGETGLIY